MIRYTVSFEKANLHIFDVTLEIDDLLNKGQIFSLPNWIPGSYMIRDFARNLVTLQASSEGESIALTKLDKSSWQLNQNVKNLKIDYQVYAWDLSVRSAHLDNQHGFFNGTSLFLEIDGYQENEHSLTLKPSKLAIKNNWSVATAMSAEKIDTQGFGNYTSQNYQEFIDHPFEFGNLKKIEFDVCGVMHQMYFTEAPDRVDWQRLACDVKQICEAEVKFFGDEKPPFDKYVFMTFVYHKGFGGLEHRASTALHCDPENLPIVGENENLITPDYRQFLSLCCHEYFHNWNVKRIKPEPFIKPNLSQEVHTELLWFFEGITSYYDELLMVRSKVIEPSSYLDMLAQTITRVMQSGGRLHQSVTESSFDAWTKFYKQDENAVNSIVSYYTKGAIVAFCLDFEIRRLTKEKKSLDDLMRYLWNNFGKKNIGLQEKQIQTITEQLVEQPMDDFFNKALYSSEDLDLQSIFELLDIQYQVIPQYVHAEKGGYVTKPKERKIIASLGFKHKTHALGAFVQSINDSSCTAKAGLSNADIIIAIDDVRVTSNDLDKVIAKIPIGEEIKISYFRRDRLYHSLCELTPSENNICYLSFKNKEPSEAAIQWMLG